MTRTDFGGLGASTFSARSVVAVDSATGSGAGLFFCRALFERAGIGSGRRFLETIGQDGGQGRIRRRHLTRVANHGHHRLEAIEAAKEHREFLGIRDAARLANLLHPVFEGVGDVRDRIVFQRGGHSLDGMGHAKNQIDGFAIGEVFLELQHCGTHFREVLRRFLEEDLAVLRHVHAQSSFSRTFLSVSITSSGLNGLTMKSLAPA